MKRIVSGSFLAAFFLIAVNVNSFGQQTKTNTGNTKSKINIPPPKKETVRNNTITDIAKNNIERRSSTADTMFSAGDSPITGIWRGNFVSEGGEQYRLEFQIKKQGDLVTGVSYSYLDVRFYGKATMTGNFNSPEKNLNIQEIRTVEVKMSSFSVACIMKYKLNYAKSGDEEFLEGTFSSKYEKSDSLFGLRRGGNCGGGTVYLRKVTTSDFYVEPFLRDKPLVKIPAPKKDSVVKKITTQVITKPPVKTNPQKTVVKTIPKKDTLIKTNPVIVPPPIVEKKIVTVPAILKTRENELAKTIVVNTNEVTIKLYDNGEIDDDTISVYVDKQLVLSHKRLSTVPIIWKLDMDEKDNSEHEVVMVAENLGRIPPNTSLMIITSGDKRYQVQITSTEQKNAVVKFKYVKPGEP
jgi:hypothetical protein